MARDTAARVWCALREARWAFVDAWRGHDEPEPAPPPPPADPPGLVEALFTATGAVLDVWAAALGASRKRGR